ncbi:MAG TPA: M67 family metallopeptidase [Pyrinomonadaceae bacterium]|nr:M67 family metallopeptidase [Pyrinomonadaceae bacterium]
MIHLTAQQQYEIAAHGERDYPHECCGLLLGQFDNGGLKVACETYSISNAREETAKRNRFLITPEELLRGERYAAQKLLDVIGFYHSHPDHPAVPSDYDREHAWPTLSYIIVSVRAGHATDVNSWTLKPDRSAFEQEEVVKGNSLC